MQIVPGSHIGPYEVIAHLGEGGMGVVFRGRDSRLQRDVALKLLPDSFASDPDRLSRFQREAQLLASLNHPNIAHIYGLEQVNGSVCIVMELVEGETLSDRLKQGPIPADEAIHIARQVGDALAAAHERGIIHRDLKPANIRLTPDGAVKVLDFGLAKAVGARASVLNMTAMPTGVGSIVGTVVGTPGYMSPEQARGKEVDARTDIWAYGCVLYEMLTAKQAFDGETMTDVMAKIVTSHADLDALPKETPPSVRLLLTSVLNKSAAERLQHIGDARLFLDGPLAQAPKVVTAAPARGGRGALVAAVAVAVLAVIAVAVLVYFRSAPQPGAEMRFEIALTGMVGNPSVSPDGGTIAYATQPADGKRTLWLRPIGSESARQLPGTDGVTSVGWSPDSRRVAVVAERKLKIFDLTDGSSRMVGDVGDVRSVAWNREGVLLMWRVTDNVIVRVSESGGPVTPITKLDAARKEILHALPVFLPDGKRFLFVSATPNVEESGIYLGSLDSAVAPTLAVQVAPRAFNGMAYSPSGYLLYLNSGTLSAQRMDASGRVEGNPVAVAEGLDNNFSVSDNGLLLYRKAAPTAGKHLVWFDREGKQNGRVGPEANYGNVDLSPKGDRAAVDIITNGNRDIWTIDLERSVPQPITFDPASDWSASWSPDGSRLAFASARAANNGANRIYEKASTGTGTETLIPSGDVPAIPVHWSADGNYIVFSRLRATGNVASYDTWLLPMFGDRVAKPLLETGFDKFQARVSPDSRYVAYSTNESGVYQIVVQTFPDSNGGKWQISAEGGAEPKWRRDGRELFYLALDGKLMSVPIGGPGFSAGRPVALFQTPLTVNRAQPTRDRRYDVAPDGRILMVVPVATAADIPYSVVVNWTARFNK